MSEGPCLIHPGVWHTAGPCPVERVIDERIADAAAIIARLTEELEATKACEPCQRDDHDNCTGDCSSMCCALAAAERERDSALADLEALRGRHKAAIAYLNDAQNVYADENNRRALGIKSSLRANILSILAPTEADRKGNNDE